MTRSKLPTILCACFCAVATFGFQCSSNSISLTVKRYSSIPPIVRWTVFSDNGRVTILDPPKTKKPFTFSISGIELDSLEKLCAPFEAFDTLYVPDRPIPNPASMDLEFERGGIIKVVHINQFPPLPPQLQALLKYEGRIEFLGVDLMSKQQSR